MANLAVIGVLFKRFYGYLVVLGIFALFGGVVTLKVGVSRKRDKNFATDDKNHRVGQEHPRHLSTLELGRSPYIDSSTHGDKACIDKAESSSMSSIARFQNSINVQEYSVRQGSARVGARS